MIDRDLEKRDYEAFEAEQLKEQETARQWRVARGEASAEDLKGPLRPGPAIREEWITVLPASRRPSAPSQTSQVFPGLRCNQPWHVASIKQHVSGLQRGYP